MQAAPNIVPLHKPTRMQLVVRAICVYCSNKGYAKSIERDAARFAVRRLRCGWMRDIEESQQAAAEYAADRD